jgi:hypothetical protein
VGSRGLVAALALFGWVACSEGHDVADMAATSDLMTPLDLATPDLAGPACGAIMLCVLVQCQVQNLMCDQTCFQGAQPKALQEAAALAICAAANCLLGGGAGGSDGGLGLVQCIESKCAKETDGCEGLPFAGAM